MTVTQGIISWAIIAAMLAAGMPVNPDTDEPDNPETGETTNPDTGETDTDGPEY